MKQIGVGIIGTGWCGGIRAKTCAAHPLVKSLHIAEIRPERLSEIAAKPLGYPNFSTTWIEFVGTEGAVMVDDSHRDVVLNTVNKGMVLPLSTMPGEAVDHAYAGPMAPETIHFLEAIAFDRPVLVTPEHARMVMEVYMAADVSAEKNEPVALQVSGAR